MDQEAGALLPTQLHEIAMHALLATVHSAESKHGVSSRGALMWAYSEHHPANGQVDSKFERVSCLVGHELHPEAPELNLWRMRYRHLEQTKGDTGEWRGVLSDYSFKWTIRMTRAALRHMAVVPSYSQDEIDRLWLLRVKTDLPTRDIDGAPIDIDALVDAEPTFEAKGLADGFSYEAIMQTLGRHATPAAVTEGELGI